MFNSKYLKIVFNALCSILGTSAFSYVQNENISVDCSQKISTATPYLFGTCLEDLNHEVYGGLYGQMIFGERFEEISSDSISKYFEIKRGKWATFETHTECEPNSEGAMLLLKEDGWQNCDVECDFGNGLVLPTTGILLNAKISEDSKVESAYFIQIRLKRSKQGIYIAKIEKNKEKELALIDKSKLTLNEDWNSIRIKISKDNGMQLFLNGKSVYTNKSLIPLEKGTKVALYTKYIHGLYRNFRIKDSNRVISVPLMGTKEAKIAGEWLANSSNGGSFSLSEVGNKKVQVLEGINKTSVAKISNKGVFGRIYLDNTENYEGYIVMKASTENAKISVGVNDDFDECVLVDGKVDDEHLKKYTFKLKSKKSGKSFGNFYIKLQGVGLVSLAQVNLQPEKKWNGANVRHDIANKMVESGIKLVRFGGTMVNNSEYKFKSMLPLAENRKTFKGFWYRYASLGFGVIEFVNFCKSAGFEPIFAINIEESPEDVADMIEYFNGASNTKMGAIRASHGRIEPYGLKYIEIGNEELIGRPDDAKGYAHYVERFKILQKAMSAKDKNLKFISAGWFAENDIVKNAFLQLDDICDFWDIHPNADAISAGTDVAKTIDHIKSCFAKWKKNYKMRLMILEENGSRCDMQRALGHSGILSAVRNDMDFVVTTCPANALQAGNKKNFNGWNQGQIHFDEKSVWGTPPYYVQRMNVENFLPRVVKTSKQKNLIISAATDERNSDLAIYITNTSDGWVRSKIDIANFKGNLKSAKVWELYGKLTDTNTSDNPKNIAPTVRVEKFDKNVQIDIRPYSHTILRFN